MIEKKNLNKIFRENIPKKSLLKNEKKISKIFNGKQNKKIK